MPRLIHENGAFDEAAISEEIERRVAASRERLKGKGWVAPDIDRQCAALRRDIAIHVNNEAHRQREPCVQAAITRLTTPAETAEMNRLSGLMNYQTMDLGGRRAWRQLALEQSRIADAIRARAIATLTNQTQAQAA